MEIIKLSNENIDLLSDKIGEMYKNAGCTSKEIMRARLMLEESMIKYQRRFGSDTELYYKEYSILSQRRFMVRLRTPSFDPFTLEENPMAFMIESVMSSFEGSMPTWKYKNLENELVFTIKTKQKLNGLVKLSISIAASVILALISLAVFPADSLSSFVTNYISPISNAYAGLFCVMAVLLTFFAITLSIVHIGDMAVVGAVGGKIMGRFYAMTTILVVIATLAIVPFYQVNGVGSISIAAKSIYDILIGFIPSNIVSPFLEFNSIHIMIIGAMFGFSLLAMGQKGETLTKIFDECNLVSIYTNNFLNKFINIYVAIKVYELLITSDFSSLKNTGKIILMIIAGEICYFLFYTAYICIKSRLSLPAFWKAVMKPFIVCLSSANFGAAFSSSIDALAELKALNDNTQLAFNLGGVVFRPACTLFFVFSSFAMASLYGVEISVVWIIMAIILSILLVASMPNIPGVSATVITLLFAQLGLPSEAVGLMIAISVPLQFITVSIDTYCLLAESVCISKWKPKKQKEK